MLSMSACGWAKGANRQCARLHALGTIGDGLCIAMERSRPSLHCNTNPAIPSSHPFSTSMPGTCDAAHHCYHEAALLPDVCCPRPFALYRVLHIIRPSPSCSTACHPSQCCHAALRCKGPSRAQRHCSIMCAILPAIMLLFFPSYSHRHAQARRLRHLSPPTAEIGTPQRCPPHNICAKHIELQHILHSVAPHAHPTCAGLIKAPNRRCQRHAHGAVCQVLHGGQEQGRWAPAAAPGQQSAVVQLGGWH